MRGCLDCQDSHKVINCLVCYCVDVSLQETDLHEKDKKDKTVCSCKPVARLFKQCPKLGGFNMGEIWKKCSQNEQSSKVILL